ncbi:kinesin-like protein KIF18B [Dermacentor silvarum]|uniref:kinesin-like protein KIF18B n=1 Tax=Dermacentor silvarum TaxID=543639 RepID=UPI0021017406|nr:kinesin-like protein KIF18B [Dermacentor silvarum]
MAPPNRKRRSNETAQPSAPKRRRSGNNLPSPGARVNVAVRVRPLRDREAETSSIIRVVDDRCLVFDPKAEAEPFYFQGQQVCAPGLVKPNKDQTFMFDQVFDDTKDNQYVFEHTTKDMLTTLLEGCNCCVFAYGPTGAGKTYTMLGSEECPGVITLTVGELYRLVEKLRSEGQTCDVAVAYMEVYNEVVRDLLCPNGPTLVVRDDPAKGIAISNLTIHKVKEAGALFQLLVKGSKNRTQHATDANEVSSRSHAIFQVYVTQTENVTSTSKGIRVSKMSFIDLAGSERAAAINRNVKERIREGTKINLSLLALGNCIDALSKSGPQRVPYRGSKLTHILKDSLGGTCRTLMIAAVTPSKLSYTDTHNTLKYAERAMKIELQAKKNVLNVNVHMTMYTALIDEYKQKVEGLQRKLDTVTTEKTALEAEVQELKDGLATMTASRDALLQARETGDGGCGPATCNDVLSTTPVLSPSVEVSPASDGRMKYYVDAAQKIYRVRAKIISQIWENEAVIRMSQIAATLLLIAAGHDPGETRSLQMAIVNPAHPLPDRCTAEPVLVTLQMFVDAAAAEASIWASVGMAIFFQSAAEMLKPASGLHQWSTSPVTRDTKTAWQLTEKAPRRTSRRILFWKGPWPKPSSQSNDSLVRKSTLASRCGSKTSIAWQ